MVTVVLKECGFKKLKINVFMLVALAISHLLMPAPLTSLDYPYLGPKWTSSGNTKGESITVPLTSCLTGLESAV